MTNGDQPQRRLRIAYLSGSPRISTRDDAEVSGPRAHILGLITALRHDGHVVDAFILGDRLARAVSGTGSGRRIAGGVARQLAVDVLRLGLRWSAARSARRHLSGGYDVVYERFALFQQLGYVFQRPATPWVVETNAVIAQEARVERDALALQRVAARLERRTYRRADLVVCISETLRTMLIDHAAVPAHKIVVIPNAVDVDRFEPTDDDDDAATGADDDVVVGFVGFLVERQGLDDLVHAVATLRRDGVGIRAVVVGDGPDRGRLDKLVAEEGVGHAVQFVGQVPWSEIPAWIARFSVGYSGQRGVGGMPMYHSPLKIYEYLASARPAVASHHPDAEAALVSTGAGWTFPAGDRAALAAVLRCVVALDRDELSARGARARRHVEQHHTWGHRCRQLVAELRGRGLVR